MVAPKKYPDELRARATRTPSRRTIRHAELTKRIVRTHRDNYGVYGARKVHATLQREGVPVAWCTVERLLRAAGLRGISRRPGPRTTRRAPPQHHPGDLVGRRFRADRLNRLWVADIAYCRTFSGFVYAEFVLDVFSRRDRMRRVGAGGDPVVPPRWWMPPIELTPVSGRYLSFTEREDIALLGAKGMSMRGIADQIGRSPSTISRELRRNAATRNGRLEYRASTAQWKADLAARRRCRRSSPNTIGYENMCSTICPE
ncbi:HTH-like domain-containing protein [Rhodococcus jostii]|uniref:HTH-like domain-containing protein n=1 Tax=Rhodococcus jostii TaxID=132919 RepID=A0A1H4ZBV9_RHOJO|nr:HTH-like domain-containing protein [Rhodococcus jostii]